jgi:hypothetical protein
LGYFADLDALLKELVFTVLLEFAHSLMVKSELRQAVGQTIKAFAMS